MGPGRHCGLGSFVGRGWREARVAAAIISAVARTSLLTPSLLFATQMIPLTLFKSALRQRSKYIVNKY